MREEPHLRHGGGSGRSASPYDLENRPVALPRRGGPSCACTLFATGLAGSLLFVTCILLEAPLVTLENTLVDRRTRAAPFRQHKESAAGAPPVAVGLWDERRTITPLQLTVSLALALNVDEEHVRVHALDAHFFSAMVLHEGDWVIDAVNSEDSAPFLAALNAQAQRFGATLVVSKNARVATNETLFEDG